MSDAKSQILANVRPVFIQHGFVGASVALLANASGLGKASLYHHFPGGKNEIAGVLLRQAVDQLQSRVFAPTQKKGDPKQRLATVVDRFVVYTGDGADHCLLALFAQEQAPMVDQAAVAALTATWRSQLSDCFEAAGAKPKAANRAAGAMLNQLYGALVLARMSDEPKLLLQAAKRIKNDLIA